MQTSGRAFLSCIALCSFTATAQAEIARVWALGESDKVFRDNTRHPLAEKNHIFQDGAVRLVALRNETVAFQVILEGGAQSTASAVTFAGVSQKNGSSLKNASGSALGGTLGRRIDMFEQHYVKIEVRSRGLGWEDESFARPKDFADQFVPDALIPIPDGHEVTVPAGKNQGLWIDLYVPKSAAPGEYVGRFEATGCQDEDCGLDVRLEILDETLPDTPTLKTMLWFSGSDNDLDVMAARYLEDPGSDPSAVQTLRERHFQLARRHRVTLFLGQYKNPNPALQSQLDGSLFTRERGYEGPGEGVGQDICVLEAYGGELSKDQAQTWITWLERVAPKATRIFYTLDEPDEEQYPEVNKRASNAKPMPAFVTSEYSPKLKVDVFAALPEGYRLSDKAKAEDAGQELWIYNGVRPYSGSFLIDDNGVSLRANAWIQYKYKIPRWFYWESTYYKDPQGGRENIDVFEEADNFRNRHGDIANGDGLLFYPGTDLVYPKQSRGLPYPLPSIRLKNWRRGLQDADILELARKKGFGAEVDAFLDKMIPHALADDLTRRDQVSWSENGDHWDEAREHVLRTAISGTWKSPPEHLGKDYTPFRTRRLLKVALAGSAGLVLFVLAVVLWRRRAR